MANESLATYLNDHLAGSVVALELLEHLAEERAGTAEASTLANVHADILADREVLEAFMAQLGIADSQPRQATAWLTEKLSELKLHLDDPGHGALRRLEALEAVSLGIAGKQALWHALDAVAEDVPSLAGLDYARLVRRAERSARWWKRFVSMPPRKRSAPAPNTRRRRSSCPISRCRARPGAHRTGHNVRNPATSTTAIAKWGVHQPVLRKPLEKTGPLH
jgi:hypothetical protein